MFMAFAIAVIAFASCGGKQTATEAEADTLTVDTMVVDTVAVDTVVAE